MRGEERRKLKKKMHAEWGDESGDHGRNYETSTIARARTNDLLERVV